jgi:oligopeptide/dipeptide ABC transporter ATP-binding protein
MQSVPRLGEKFIHGRKTLDEIPGMVPSLQHLPPGCLFEPRCKVAEEICKHQKPPLTDLEGNVKCRCWLVA